MPDGPLCVNGPLSAIRMTRVFSAMPSVFNSVISSPIHTSSRARASCGNAPLAVREAEQGSHDGPVVDVKRLFRCCVLANELNGPFLHLRVELIVVFESCSTELAHRSALRSFQRKHKACRTPSGVDVVGVLGEHFREHDPGGLSAF